MGRRARRRSGAAARLRDDRRAGQPACRQPAARRARRGGRPRGGAGEDWRPEEHPLEGWEEFRVTDQQHEVIRGRFHEVNKDLGPQGVRFMFGKNLDDPEWSLVQINPGASGLDPRQVLDRLLGPGS
jgi:hypothetical protein